MTEFDVIDRKLLVALQADGRMTNQDLAQQVNLSPAACSERVKRLRDRGVIVGVSAILDPEQVGLPLLIFIEVSLERTTTGVLHEFAAQVRNIPQILECHLVAGGFDYLIKARLRDMAAYRAFLGDVLVQLPGVRETRTYAVMEEVKSSPILPL